jgi:hypothetical protein
LEWGIVSPEEVYVNVSMAAVFVEIERSVLRNSNEKYTAIEESPVFLPIKTHLAS